MDPLLIIYSQYMIFLIFGLAFSFHALKFLIIRSKGFESFPGYMIRKSTAVIIFSIVLGSVITATGTLVLKSVYCRSAGHEEFKPANPGGLVAFSREASQNLGLNGCDSEYCAFLTNIFNYVGIYVDEPSAGWLSEMKGEYVYYKSQLGDDHCSMFLALSQLRKDHFRRNAGIALDQCIASQFKKFSDPDVTINISHYVDRIGPFIIIREIIEIKEGEGVLISRQNNNSFIFIDPYGESRYGQWCAGNRSMIDVLKYSLRN